MRKIFCLLLILPLLSMAQVKDTAHKASGYALLNSLDGFMEAGFMTEQWSLEKKASHYYSATNYSGGGFFLGVGAKTKTGPKRPLGFGLSVNYVGYKMSGALALNEKVPEGYDYLRFAPALYFEIRTRSGVTILSSGSFNVLFHLHDGQANYSQIGLKSGVEFKMLGINVGYNFMSATSSPAVKIETSKWVEKMVALSLVVYPSRVAHKTLSSSLHYENEKK